MTRPGIVAALAVLMVACAAACGGTPASVSPSDASARPSAPAPTEPAALDPTRICDVSQEDVEPVVTCTEIIGRVLLALGPDRGAVRAAWMRFGAPCPPNARCVAPPPGSTYVLLDIDGGATMAVRVATAGGRVEVAPPEQLGWDEWPATGSVAPAPGAPDVGPDPPAEIATRQPLPFCGEDLPATDDRQDRSCFWAAVRDGRPVELIVRGGEPSLELLRYAGRGPVLVYRQPVEAGDWTLSDCAIGSAFDDELIFLVHECLEVPLS